MPYTAITPNHAAFGQEQDAYLKALLSPTGDPTADAINRLTLMGKAGSGTDDGYMQALREANQFQAQGQQREIQGDVAKAYLPAAGALAKEGVAGAVLPNADNQYLRVAPNRLNQSDAVHLQGMQAETVKNTGAGVKDLAASGFAPDPAYIGGMITPPIQDTPAPVKTYLSPENKAKQLTSQADMERAKADMLHAQKYDGHQGGSGDKTVTTFVVDPKTGARTPISVTTTDKGGPAPAAAPAAPAAAGHLERDPKTNQLHWVPASK